MSFTLMIRGRAPTRYRPELEALEARTLLAGNLAVGTNLVALTDHNALVTFNSASPSTISQPTPITGLQIDEQALSIDVRPATGQLYALTDAGRLYTVDAVTGAATLAAAHTPPVGGTNISFTFDPVVDQIRLVTDLGYNLRLNPDGTLAAIDTTLAYAAGDPNAGINPQLAFVASSNHLPNAATTTYYGVDSSLHELVRLGDSAGQPPPNSGQLFSIVPVPVIDGFTIGGPDNIAYFVDQTTGPPNPISSLWTVDLGSHVEIRLGDIGAVGTVRSLAVLPAAAAPSTPPTISIGDASVAESSGASSVNAVFTVSLSAASSLPVTVQVSTQNRTAIAPQEYQPLAAVTVTFPPGQATEPVTVQINDNHLQGGVETFVVTLGQPTNGTLGRSQGIGTIANHPVVAPAADQVLVERFYIDLLGRLPDDGGQASWQSLLQSGVPVTAVVQGIVDSNEYAVKQVESWYTLLLHRPAGALEIQAVQDVLAQGVPAEQVEAGILASPEYFADQGGTIGGFLGGVYRDELGRGIDSGGALGWAAALAGGESRAWVADQILRSREADADQVQAHYRRLLGRDAEPDALRVWTFSLLSAADSSARDQKLRDMGIAITSSGEYIERSRFELLDQQFVTKLYHDLLRRAPDPGGYLNWIGLLDSNALAREDVVQHFMDSPEYQGLFVADRYADFGGGFQPDATETSNDVAFIMASGGPGFTLERQRTLISQDFAHYPDPAQNGVFNFFSLLFSDFFGIPVFDPADSRAKIYEDELREGFAFNDIALGALVTTDFSTWLEQRYLNQFLGGIKPNRNELVKYLGESTGAPVAVFTGSQCLFADVEQVFLNDASGSGGAPANRIALCPEDCFAAALLGTSEYYPKD
jgi:hypothetical protein